MSGDFVLTRQLIEQSSGKGYEREQTRKARELFTILLSPQERIVLQLSQFDRLINSEIELVTGLAECEVQRILKGIERLMESLLEIGDRRLRIIQAWS